MNSEYQKTLNWLFKQFPSYQLIGSKAYKPTLENTNRLLALFDHPENSLKFIHVAGSNGKGSVCSMIASTLTERNYKVGLFTSPHIKDFSERIRVNGEVIDQEFVVDFVYKIKSFELDFEPSFFEISFVLALIYFKAKKCDFCVIETGLGGRLDATNVITPLLSIITSISLEHTNILGNTLSEIAIEKAGIIKNDIPIVVGHMPKECESVIVSKARSTHSQVIKSIESIPLEIEQKLIADYQIQNMQTSIAGLKFIIPDVSNQHLINGFSNLKKNTGFYGRLQIVDTNPLIIYDVSHNTDGIIATLSAIKKLTKGSLHIVYGSSSDKNIEEIRNVFPTNGHYYITEFSSERSAKLSDLKMIFNGSSLESIDYFTSPELALSAAKKNASELDTIVVMGSFFLIEHFF